MALFYKGFLPGPSSLPSSPPHPVHATGKQKRKAKFSDQKDSFAQTLQRTMHTDNNAAEQQLFDKVPLRRCHQKLNAILPMVHTHSLILQSPADGCSWHTISRSVAGPRWHLKAIRKNEAVF